VNRRYLRGSSLIEVLVTALILAIGLLGLAALQGRSLQYNHGSALRSQANIASSDILDRMRLNRDAATAGLYDTAYGHAETGTGSLADKDKNEWKDSLKNILPAGDGAITCTVNSCQISVHWQERVLDDAPAATVAATQISEFIYTTRL